MALSRSHRLRRHFWLAAAMLLAAVASFSAPAGDCRSAHATDTFPSDYCYQTDIAITYSGSGTVTYQPVRVQMNASGMIGTGQIDSRAWDIKPILGSMTNEVMLTAQELGSTTSPWWILVPSISEDETRTHRLYSGSGEQRRDQGIWFNVNERVVVPDDAVFDITNNLRIDVEMQLLEDPGFNSVWLEHHSNTNRGYRVQWEYVATVLNITFVIGDGTDNANCRLQWDTDWNNERQLFSFQWVTASGTDATIYRNGTLAQSCDLDQSGIGVTTNPFVMGVIAGAEGGNTFTSAPLRKTILQDVRIWDGSTEVAHYGFDADAMTETVDTNPFEGTVEDYGPNGLTGAYRFNRSQTDWTYSVGPTQLVSGATQITLPDTNPDVLGPVFGFDPSVVTPELQDGIFWEVFLNEWVSTSPVRSYGFVAVLSLFGLFLAIAVYRLTKYVPLALFVMGIPLAVGVGNGWIPVWWMVLWIVMAVGGWFAQRQTESP